MALVFKDRVQETTTTTGLGSYVLNGPDVSFQAFSAVGDGNTCHYIVTDGTDWESGLGTYTLAGTTLARTTIYESSNGGAAVNWPSGSKSILIAPLATFATAYYAHAADTDIHLDRTVNEAISGLWRFAANGTGDITDYDVQVGDATPNYGIIRVGSALLGRTSHTSADGPPLYNLNGTMIFENPAGPVTGDIEFAFLDSAGLVRFALPKSAVGNATFNPRSMIIAGPAVADSDEVTLAYWQTQGIFHNLTMDTAGSGADLGVQNDLEVEGTIYTDSIDESTPAAGITFGVSPNVGGNALLDAGDIGVTVQGYDADTAKLDVAQDWTAIQTFKEHVDFWTDAAIKIGADSGAHTRTDATPKTFRLGGAHYTNAQLPVSALMAYSDAGANVVYVGGGTGGMNAATRLDFYTAANNTTPTGTLNARVNSSGVWQFTSTPNVGGTDVSLTTHNHSGVYEPAFSKNTGFNKNFGTSAGTVSEGNHTHTGVYEPADATILKDADIGVTVQAYNANNALLSNITYEQLNTNGDVGTGAGQLAIGNHTHTGVYEPADATILKDADIGSTVQPQMSIQATAPAIGSVSDGHLWLNSDTGDTYVAFEDSDLTRQWILQSSPSNLLAQGVYARLAVNETVTGSWSFGTIDINGGSVDAAVIGGSSAAAGTFTTLTANTSLTTPLVQSSAAELSLRAGGANLVSVYTNGSEKARFPSGGGQYLGTTTPIGSAFLSVNSGTTQASAAFTGNTLASELRIQHPASNVVRLDVGSGNALAFGHNGTELARYTTLGQLMLGSSTVIPSWYTGTAGHLYVGKANYGVLQLVGFDSVNSDAGGVIVLGRSRSASVGTLTTTNSGDYLGTLSFEGVTTNNGCEASAFITVMQDGAAGSSYIPGRMEFWVGNTSLVRHIIDFDKNGRIVFDTTHADGIQFNADLASSDANTLDDYEEGTFTPILMDATLSAGESQTASTQAGTYTKIGSFVYFEFHLTMSSLGTLTTTDTARIGGLPFTSKSNSNGTGTGSVGYYSGFSMGSSSESPIVYVIGNGTALIIYSQGTSAANASAISVGEFTATGNIWISGHYKTS